MQGKTTKNLNFRKAPAIQAEAICVIPAGTTIELITQNNGWGGIKYNDKLGYVSLQFVSLYANVSPQPQRQIFYDKIVKNGLFKKLSASQKQGIEATLNEWDYWIANNWVDNDLRKLAYILATDYHEGDRTMQPIKEYGGDAYFVKRYWTNQKKAKELGNRSRQDAIDFCGKGKPMITGYANYKKMGKILGYDLVNNPDLMFDLKVATEVMFEGMLTGKSLGGDFTGKHLGNYFNSTKNDPEGARYVINGKDDAGLIAGYYRLFLAALS